MFHVPLRALCFRPLDMMKHPHDGNELKIISGIIELEKFTLYHDNWVFRRAGSWEFLLLHGHFISGHKAKARKNNFPPPIKLNMLIGFFATTCNLSCRPKCRQCEALPEWSGDI